MSTLSIRLPENVDKRLDYLSQKTGRTKTYYVREAVAEHIEEMEDIYLALDRLEKPGKRWSLEALENKCDVES